MYKNAWAPTCPGRGSRDKTFHAENPSFIWASFENTLAFRADGCTRNKLLGHQACVALNPKP